MLNKMKFQQGTGVDQPQVPNRTYRCVVSAGPTREYLDPFRFISNPSSGKMGYAIAGAAAQRGWSVDLVSGPTSLPEPENCIFYPVETGEEMFHQIDALYDACDILIMCAAVCDYRPTEYSAQKLKKKDQQQSILFQPVRDIIATVNQRKKAQFVVGFAAETENLEEYARKKLTEKNLDMIVANKIGVFGSGFGADQNELLIILANGDQHRLGPKDKTALGKELVSLIDAQISHPATMEGDAPSSPPENPNH